MAGKIPPQARAQVLTLLNRYNRLLAKAFVTGMETLRNAVNFDQVEEDLTNGTAVLGLVTLDMVQNSFNDFLITMSTAFVDFGQLNASFVPELNLDGVKLNVKFDVMNPALGDVLQDYKPDLITSITTDVQNNIQGIIDRNVTQGINPRTQARQIVNDLHDSFGLTPRQEIAVQNYKNALENMSTDALERELRDKRFDRTVFNSIKQQNSLTDEQIDKMVSAYRRKYLNYRATTIARTENIRLLNGSNHALWKDMTAKGQVDEDRVRREWIYTHDDRVREAHTTVDDMNPDGVGLDEPFQTELGPLMFPGDPDGDPANVINCRCYVFYKIV